jgi:hypothetical protein
MMCEAAYENRINNKYLKIIKMMGFKNLARGTRPQILMKHSMSNQMAVANRRNYFSFVDKMRDRFNKPWRHV